MIYGVSSLHFFNLQQRLLSNRIPNANMYNRKRHVSENLVSVALNKALNSLVSTLSRILQVNTMTTVGRKVSRARSSGSRVKRSKNRLRLSLSAVASAERQVLLTVDDDDGTGVASGWLAHKADGEELAVGSGALLCGGGSEDTGIEAGEVEESDLIADGGVGGDVSIRQSTETKRVVLVSNSQVQSRQESRESRLVEGEASEDCGVKDGRVVGRDGFGQD